MKRKILGSVWKHPAQQGRCVGIIAVETEAHKPQDKRTWNAVVGIVSFPLTEENDAQLISTVGDKLSAAEAKGFFPDLDISKYKEL